MTILPSVVDILTIIIFIVPGFMTLLVASRIGIEEKEYSEFETIVWSIIFSLLIYVSFSQIVGISGIDVYAEQVLHPQKLAIILSIGFGYGLLFGVITKIVFRRNIIAGDCWDVFQKRIGKNECFVIVYTNNGLEYKGQLHYAGKGKAQREIIVYKPKLIIRDEDWAIKEEMEIGKELLFTEKDIQRIVFFKDL